MRDFYTTPRLYLPQAVGDIIHLDASHVHYLTKVLKLRNGELVRLFNGHTEFISKMEGSTLLVQGKLREGQLKVFINLAPALIDSRNMSTMIDMSVQLGVASIKPIVTERSQYRQINLDRYQKIIAKSIEQSEILHVPIIESAISLAELLKKDQSDLVICANEHEESRCLLDIDLSGVSKITIIIGPEGGFTASELHVLSSRSHSVRLTQSILRAETAAAAAISQIQLLFAKLS